MIEKRYVIGPDVDYLFNELPREVRMDVELCIQYIDNEKKLNELMQTERERLQRENKILKRKKEEAKKLRDLKPIPFLLNDKPI